MLRRRHVHSSECCHYVLSSIRLIILDIRIPIHTLSALLYHMQMVGFSELNYFYVQFPIFIGSTSRAFSGVFGHLKKNPVKIFTIEKRKGPRQKFSGITHPLSYKA